MSFKMRCFGFSRTAYVMDLRVMADETRLKDIRRKALRYETLKHTAGVVSCFN